jgi:hypothetical protein
MRKITLFAVALLAANLSFAQKGLEVGVEFTPAVTFILNDEDFAEGEALNFKGTFGYNTGLSVGFNFTEGLGISSGLLLSRQGQNYVTDYAGVAKADQAEFSRNLTYVRLPLLLKFNSDPTASSGSYFRFGPHFDFLSGARYKYENNATIGIDRDVNLLKDSPYSDLEIYNKFVFGVTLEFGGSANINENLKLTFMLHMSGNLNSEGKDAALLSALGIRYPNTITTSSVERQSAYNVMGGLNVGLRYCIPFN